MVTESSAELLTKGLLEGYASPTPPTKIERNGFSGKSTDYNGPEGHYHDEWFGRQSGGGQELAATSDGEISTRLYGGGPVPEEMLSKLGLTKKMVNDKVVDFVGKLGDKTRLNKPARAKDGKWGYEYIILESRPEIPIDLAKEKVTYDDQMVFIHYHIYTVVK